MNWDLRHHKAWTIDWYRDAEASRLARAARRFRTRGRWRFWRRRTE